MTKNKKIVYPLVLIPIIIILFLFGWFLAIIFEGEKPVITIEPRLEFLSGKQEFSLNIKDMKRGLRRLKVSAHQEGRESTLFEKEFPFKGLLNRNGTHQFEKVVSVDPVTLNLPQGRVDLKVRVWDYSRRGGGDGNMGIAQHKMIVDTIPPAIRTISRMHNINMGGACLVVYQTSSDTIKSGVFIEDLFCPGFPAGRKAKNNIHICYFAVPYNSKLKPSIYLWAEDRAGNRSKSSFYYHIRKKRFRRDRIVITDNFLNHVLPHFSFYPLNPEDSNIKKYLKINRDLRKENNETFRKVSEKTSTEKLWDGAWLRLKNAANMARFADRRFYYYRGKKVDEQIHLGVDLASLVNSPIQAGNNGRVIFADSNGIYGLTIVLDHGQGLASIYAHLSKLEVTLDQEIKKGEIIGFTGQTGLAGGDHLHFGFMVNGILVNPIEWWDNHWIKDNIDKKLALIEKR